VSHRSTIRRAIRRLAQAVRRGLATPRPVRLGAEDLPEEYWIKRGAEVIGRATTDALLNSRQADTYLAIADAVRGYPRILDLGCNVAALGRIAYATGYDGSYTGVDSNPYAISEADRELQALGRACDVRTGNIRDLPFPDLSFSCVVMKDVLEHMEGFEALLAEACRVTDEMLVVANFIPWTEGDPIIRREPDGFFHNLYRRADVYASARTHGFGVHRVISALETDARANEIVLFRRDGRG
jgi:SAM-dependent methyltransferase